MTGPDLATLPAGAVRSELEPLIMAGSATAEQVRAYLAAIPAEAREALEAATDDGLAGIVGAGHAEATPWAIAEVMRRDYALAQARETERAVSEERAGREARRRAWQASPAGQRYAAVDAAWYDQAHSEYERAEEWCRSDANMLSPAAPDRDAFPMLWTCSDAQFERYASEDMQRWRQYEAGPQGFTRRAPWFAVHMAPRREERNYPWRDDPTWTEPARAEAGAGEVTPPATSGDPGAAQRRAQRAQATAALLGRVGTYAPGAVAAAREAGPVSTTKAPCAGCTGPGPDCKHPERWGNVAQVPPAAPGQPGAALATLPAGLPVLPPPPPMAAREIGPPQPFRYKTEAGQLVEVTAKYWLDYMAAFYGRYLYWPSASALVVSVLWAAHTYARESAEAGARLILPVSPRIFYLSSKRDSGKSTALTLLMLTCPRVYGRETEPTEYGLVDSISMEQPTLIIDELGILTEGDKRKKGVQSVLLNGYTPGGTKLRTVNKKPQRVPVFAPVALAGLDVVEKTASENIRAILSRGFRIHMQPAPDGAEPADMDAEADYVASVAGRIRLAGTGWAATNREWLRAYRPPPVEGTHRRYRQICGPLATVADAAGPEWSRRGREALAALQSSWVDEGTLTQEDPMEAMLRDLAAMEISQ